jgi:hypothetical protein
LGVLLFVSMFQIPGNNKRCDNPLVRIIGTFMMPEPENLKV